MVTPAVRFASALAVASVALLTLAGCQPTPGAFVRATAQADVAAWTREAEAAAGSPDATVRSDGYETCRTDTGLFTMRFQWRTITNLGVSADDQDSVTADISNAFAADGWTSKDTPGLVTLNGPKSAKHKGVVRLETAGPSQLSVTVISPCYP